MSTTGATKALALLALSVALAIPNPAAAVPIFFSDSVLAGFDPFDVAAAGLTPSLFETSTRQIATSNSGDAGLLQVVRTSPRPDIIARPQSEGLDPSPADPYIANIAFTVIAMLVVLISIPVGAMFVLDAIQLRQSVNEAGLRVFDSSSIGALFHLAMLFAVYSTYAFQGVKTLRHKGRKRRMV